MLVAHIRLLHGAEPRPGALVLGYDTPRTLYRHHKLIRAYLGVTPLRQSARHQAALAIREAARRMDRPADLINVAIETLVKERCGLPAFSRLAYALPHIVPILPDWWAPKCCPFQRSLGAELD